MKKILALLLIGFMFIAVSCDKDDNNESAYLLESITSTSSHEGTYSYDFEYNNQNRLIGIVLEDETEITETKYNYNNKGEISEEFVTIEDKETHKRVYTRSLNLLTIIDYTKNEDNEWVEDNYKITYEFDNDGLLLKYEYFYKFDTIYEAWSYSILTWENGNVSTVESWLNSTLKSNIYKRHQNQLFTQNFNYPILKSTNDELFFTATYEYDTKNNPIAIVGNPFMPGYNSKNNAIKMTLSYGSILEEDEDEFNYTYEYNDREFPIKGSFTFINSDNETVTEIALFEYTEK